MTRRTALLGMVLALTAAPSESQTRFDVSMGPQFGMQDRETPLSRGWIVSAGFEIDGQDFVVEGSWHLSGSAHERYFGGDDPRHDIGLELHSGRILVAGRRRPQPEVGAPRGALLPSAGGRGPVRVEDGLRVSRGPRRRSRERPKLRDLR